MKYIIFIYDSFMLDSYECVLDIRFNIYWRITYFTVHVFADCGTAQFYKYNVLCVIYIYCEMQPLRFQATDIGERQQFKQESKTAGTTENPSRPKILLCEIQINMIVHI